MALTSGIFFLLVLLLTIREFSVVDIIGKILTPALVLGLLTLIVAGVISPLGEISDDHMMDNVVVAGINSVPDNGCPGGDDFRDHHRKKCDGQGLYGNAREV